MKAGTSGGETQKKNPTPPSSKQGTTNYDETIKAAKITVSARQPDPVKPAETQPHTLFVVSFFFPLFSID